ncbi:hypothetical protein [Streptomyces sp. NPDC058657]|uniref:hypothetical protein n=1 Tax=unclassified Streptomyces TaxID=2593676 RepID=UPI00364D34E3
MFEITIKDRDAKYQGSCSTRRIFLPEEEIGDVLKLGSILHRNANALLSSRAGEAEIEAMVRRILAAPITY